MQAFADPGRFSVPLALIIHDTARCLYKVSLSLTVLIPFSSKNSQSQIESRKEDFKRKDKGADMP